MPFGIPDLSLPEDFAVSPIAKPKRKSNGVLFGRDKPAVGKPKGVVSKITRDIKQGILNGAIAHGFDGEGLGGLDGYFQMCAARYPKHYMHLLGKLMPLQVSGDMGHHISAVNIISIPSDTYLSAADIEKYRAPGRSSFERIAPPGDVAVENLDVTPQSAIELSAQEFEPQTARERQLLAELEALSPEQLLERARQAGYVDADSGQTG